MVSLCSLPLYFFSLPLRSGHFLSFPLPSPTEEPDKNQPVAFKSNNPTDRSLCHLPLIKQMANVKSCSESASGELHEKCAFGVQELPVKLGSFCSSLEQSQPDYISILNGCLKWLSLSGSHPWLSCQSQVHVGQRVRAPQNFLCPRTSRICRKACHWPSSLPRHHPAWHCLTTELCPINLLCILLRQKGPSKIIPDLLFCVSFLCILYHFAHLSHSEICAKKAPKLVFPWEDPNSGLGSFPPWPGVFSNIPVQKSWRLCLIQLLTLALVQCLVTRKDSACLLSEGINTESDFCFSLEAVPLHFSASVSHPAQDPCLISECFLQFSSIIFWASFSCRFCLLSWWSWTMGFSSWVFSFWGNWGHFSQVYH